MKLLQRRFVFFNMLVISGIMLILAFLVGMSARSTLSVDRTIQAACIGIGLSFIGSLLLSKIALSPIKAAWQKQLDFTADASHELRTPLAAIQANLDVVMHCPTASVESQVKWLKSIGAENKRMSRLVADLLFLSRADTDETVFETVDFDLSQLVTETLVAFEAAIKRKGLSLKPAIDSDIVFHGDLGRIKQHLVILLDNAIQYNRENGNLDVSLTVEGKEAIIKVSDTGAGIDKRELERIFDRFYRGSEARQSNPDGSGLGLAIAKMIAREHSGTIVAESQIDEWTKITTHLPL